MLQKISVFNKCSSFELLYLLNKQQNGQFPQKNTVFDFNIRMFLEQQISISWFINDHVTLNTDLKAAENSVLPLHFKICSTRTVILININNK